MAAPIFWLPPGMGFEVLCGVGAVLVMDLFFAVIYGADFWVVLCSVPIAFLPSVAICLLDRSLTGLCGVVQKRIGRLQTVFLAFFGRLLSGVVVFLFLLAYPMSLVFSWSGSEEMARHYGRWAANLGIVSAIIFWLRCSFRKFFTRAG